MTYTLADLRAQCLDLLGDPGNQTFTSAQIDDWINRAIEDLSIHFPQFADYTLSTHLGVHIYELETYIKGVVAVEYPSGQNPPRFLKRRSFTHPQFYSEAGYYDFYKPQSSDSQNPPLIYISDYTPLSTPANLTVKCAIDHSPLADASDACTVLDRHIHLIALFVRWKAYSERGSHEMMDPSPLAVRTSIMENATQKAMQAYEDALARAVTTEAESAQVSWKMDNADRIY